MGGGGVTDPAEDTKGNDDRGDLNESTEPEIRTDGGEVIAQNSGLGLSDVPGGPTVRLPPEAPSITDRRGEKQASLPETKLSSGNQVDDLPASVESHFTPAELQRLQRIAASTNAKSAWVIKRLFRNSEE